MGRLTNPKSEVLAFYIWAYASPLGWDCTVKDIAEELGESWQRVRRVCTIKGWSGRLRCAEDSPELFMKSADTAIGWFSTKREFASYADALKYSEHLL